MINKLFIYGRLESEVRIAEGKTGNQYAKFSLLCEETLPGKNGGQYTQSAWIEMTAFGETCKVASQLRQGQYVLVEGKLTSNLYTPPNGAPKQIMGITANKISPVDVPMAQPRPQNQNSMPMPQPIAQQQQAWQQQRFGQPAQQQQPVDPYNYPWPAQSAQQPSPRQNNGMTPLPDDIPF